MAKRLAVFVLIAAVELDDEVELLEERPIVTAPPAPLVIKPLRAAKRGAAKKVAA